MLRSQPAAVIPRVQKNKIMNPKRLNSIPRGFRADPFRTCGRSKPPRLPVRQPVGKELSEIRRSGRHCPRQVLAFRVKTEPRGSLPRVGKDLKTHPLNLNCPDCQRKHSSRRVNYFGRVDSEAQGRLDRRFLPASSEVARQSAKEGRGARV